MCKLLNKRPTEWYIHRSVPTPLPHGRAGEVISGIITVTSEITREERYRTRSCDASRTHVAHPAVRGVAATPSFLAAHSEFKFFCFLPSRIPDYMRTTRVLVSKSKNARNKLEDVSFAIPSRWRSSGEQARILIFFFSLSSSRESRSRAPRRIASVENGTRARSRRREIDARATRALNV